MGWGASVAGSVVLSSSFGGRKYCSFFLPFSACSLDRDRLLGRGGAFGQAGRVEYVLENERKTTARNVPSLKIASVFGSERSRNKKPSICYFQRFCDINLF